MRILRQLSIVLAFLLAVTGMAAAQEYRLGSQDKITVNVYGEDDLSGEFELDGEGKVALPLLGDIHVGNMTLREAENAIAERLHPDYLVDPKVSIQVSNSRPFYILGGIGSEWCRERVCKSE